jgi:hypothetical protein
MIALAATIIAPDAPRPSTSLRVRRFLNSAAASHAGRRKMKEWFA